MKGSVKSLVGASRIAKAFSPQKAAPTDPYAAAEGVPTPGDAAEKGSTLPKDRSIGVEDGQNMILNGGTQGNGFNYQNQRNEIQELKEMQINIKE